MTEEEARSENTQPKASQPNEKPERQKSLTDKISALFTGNISINQTKEQKTMADSEETRIENIQPQAQQISLSPPTPPEGAVIQFNEIKKALVGSEPEWRLPKVDEKALASEPKLVEPPVSQPCGIIL